MVKLTSSTWTWPVASTTVRPSTTRASSPSFGGSLCTVSSTGRPTISAASSALLAVGSASPTTLPSRITVIRSATSRTSRSLWVMKTIAFAGLLELAHDLHQLVGLLGGQHRGRLVEDQDLGVARERLDDLDPLLHADRQVLDDGVGVDVEAEPVGDLLDPLPGGVEVERPGEAGRLVAEHDVLGDGEDRDQHEVLVDHADAGRDRVAGAGEVLDLVVEDDLALVGLVEAVEHVHQRRLAGAVLAEQAVDLAGLDGQGDPVVGDERPEALGDVAQGELHGGILV